MSEFDRESIGGGSGCGRASRSQRGERVSEWHGRAVECESDNIDVSFGFVCSRRGLPEAR